MKTRTCARGGSLRLAALVACLGMTGTAYAATAPDGGATASGGVTMAGAGTTQKLRYGQEVRLNGRLAPGTAGRQVRLEHAPARRGWRPAAQATSGTGGSYGFSVRARQSGAYRAVAESGGASAPRQVSVVARLAGCASRHVRTGRRVRVRGALRPGLRGRVVRLQLRAGRRWRTVARARTAAGGRFRTSWRPPRHGSYRLRVAFRGDTLNLGVGRRLAGRVNVYRPGHASWYGPGLYGNHLGCGGRLAPSTVGVAHKTLPCGTRVTFRYRGRSATARVVDRGPYVGGREWDLTAALKRRLGFGSTGTVWSTR